MCRKAFAPILMSAVVATLLAAGIASYYLHARLHFVTPISSSITVAIASSESVVPTTVPIGERKNGLLGDDPNFFPIAVWDQASSTASSYTKIGIDLFTGVPGGVTDLTRFARHPYAINSGDRLPLARPRLPISYGYQRLVSAG